MNEQQFEKLTAHEQEIIRSRVGGLGGSDAAMVLKIGRNGIDAISQTDKERLAIMLGLKEYKPIPANDAMAAGHLFEDYVATEVVDDLNKDGRNFEREYLMNNAKACQFHVFAHADFFDANTGVVLECKFSQKTTDEVERNYQAQLQWYYMLGATEVKLVHGQGSVEPFAVENATVRSVEKDDYIIEQLVHGLVLIGGYIRNNEKELNMAAKTETQTAEQLPAEQQSNVVACRSRLAQIKEAENVIVKMKEELLQYMEQSGITRIDADGCRVSYISPGVRRVFNRNKAINDYPALANSEYYDNQNVKSSIKIELL